MRLPLVLTAVSFLAATPAALACSTIIGYEPYEADTTLADTAPPSTPTLGPASLTQRNDRDNSAACGDVSVLSLPFTQVATDDVSTAARIGYLVEVVDGELPSGLTLPTTPVRFADEPDRLVFIYGASNQDVRVRLRVTALDEAGNRSAASAPIEVTGERNLLAGCSAAGSASDRGLAWLVVLAAAALGLRRKSSRRFA